jgi:hypothetical protein
MSVAPALNSPAPSGTGPSAAALKYVAEVAEIVRSGECNLFLGAGVHSLPPALCPYSYAEAEAPPRGAELSRQLAIECKVGEDVVGDVTDLRRTSLYYEREKFGRSQLIGAVFQRVQQNSQPSPMLRALAELPFSYVITTNYDNLFERALAQVKKDCEVSVYTAARKAPKSPGRAIGPHRPFLLKVHGDFSREQEEQSVVITEEDYITFILRMRDADELNPVPLAIRAKLAQNPTIFVGYSLNDYNLRILFRALRYTGDRGGLPSSFSVDPWPNPVVHQLLVNDYKIVFVAEDLWRFVPLLYQAVLGKELSL